MTFKNIFFIAFQAKYIKYQKKQNIKEKEKENKILEALDFRGKWV